MIEGGNFCLGKNAPFRILNNWNRGNQISISQGTPVIKCMTLSKGAHIPNVDTAEARQQEAK